VGARIWIAIPLTRRSIGTSESAQASQITIAPSKEPRVTKVSRRSAFGRQAAIASFAALVLMLVGAAVLHVGSAWRLRQMPNVPAVIKVPTGGDAVEGSRLASVLGCRGCHGQDLGGRANCYEKLDTFQLTCPNVTEARSKYDDEALVALLRYGRKSDGALVDFMPWDMYAQLSEGDLAHVIAFVRAAPIVRKEALPPSTYSWAIRWQMLRGSYPEQNNLLDYDSVRLKGPAERGRYLASIACPECHAPSLRGYAGDDAPNLIVAKAYTLEAFARLMREGITLAGTESRTGLMTSVARGRFAYLSPDDVVALKLYLDQRSP
jgi:cytochrome c553